MSDLNEIKERLARLSPEQKAMLEKRLADGPNAPSKEIYLKITPATPLRTEEKIISDQTIERTFIHSASFGQQRMWFLHEYANRFPVYVIPSSFHLKGELNETILLDAIGDVVRRHDTLRTTFLMEDGQLLQRVSSEAYLPWERRDFQPLPAERRSEETTKFLNELISSPFDLSAGPAFRVGVARLDHDEHVLCFVIHHIISDGWSRSILWRDLANHYMARMENRQVMSTHAVQFADYTSWQKQQLSGDLFEKQAAYWKSKLTGDIDALELPADRPRPIEESFRGAQTSVALDSALISKLTDLAKDQGATLFMILFASYNVLLGRYTGREDLIIGVPIANRQRTEVEELIGVFANTLVLRTNLRNDPTFKDLLEQVKSTAIEAYSHQDIPFDQLVEILNVHRESSSTPVFQVSFALQDFPEANFDLKGIDSKPWKIESKTSKFDFHLGIEKDGGSWIARAEYNTDLFDRDRIDRMLEHWMVMLNDIAMDPCQRVSNIDILSPAERQKQLVEWNQTKRDYPQDRCLHELFVEQVKRSPDAVAVVFEGAYTTYRDLNDRANRLAHYLQSLGVKSETRVGICMERSLEMVVGVLGVLKAGAAYLPLEPDYPPERLSYMTSDSAVSIMITSEPLKKIFGASDLRYISMDTDWPAIQAFPSHNPDSSVLPSSLAYMIYTSGSTGRPKGAMIMHQSAVNLLCWIQEAYPMGVDDAIIQKSPFSFDASIWEFYSPLLAGARLVLASPGGQLDPSYLIKTIRSENVTHMITSPSFLRVLVNTTDFDLCKSLRWIFTAGETISPDLAREIKSATKADLINIYGPTEVTVVSTHHLIDSRSLDCRSIPIGRPVSNLRAYILDKNLNLLPTGLVGDLYFGGVGLARGYHNLPDLTADRFLPDPFCSAPNSRIYKTGDLASYLPDGSIEFHGRMDHQVKIRGFRVELTEIEHALRRCAGVKEAVVTTKEAREGDLLLIAYLVARDHFKLDTSSLRSELASILPQHMMPNSFVIMESLPLSPNGKIDVKNLPLPENIKSPAIDQDNQAKSLLEHELIKIWENIFQRTGIGRNDNFFELGGHSIQAMQLAADIDKLLNKKIPISTLFQSPTIASFATRLTNDKWAPDWNSLVPLQPHGTKPPLFIVHGYGGDVFEQLNLARRMKNKNRPVYGLQALGLDGITPRHSSLEEMAKHYVREIISFKPRGPYRIAGYSVGGWIAFEVAQELIRQERKVVFLGLLDTRSGNRIPPHFIYQLEHRFKEAKKLGSEYFRYYTCLLLRKLPIRRFRDLPGKKPVKKTKQLERNEYYSNLELKYVPDSYPSTIDFFAAEKCDEYTKQYWKRMAKGGLIIHHLTGIHLMIIKRKNIGSTSNKLEKAIQSRDAELKKRNQRK